MPEPVTSTQIDQALAEWDRLLPEGEEPDFLIGESEQRAAGIRGLREFADLMESRPDLPLPNDIFVMVRFVGTTEQRLAQLDHAAGLVGQPAVPSTTGSGTLRAMQRFGPVRYSLSAYPAEDSAAPAFAVGQEVRLTADAAHVAETVRLAQTGTVVGAEPDPYGMFTYAVHFPGRTGTQRGWAESALTEARPFGPIRVSTGQVTSLQAAEALLIERRAQAKLLALSARQPDDALISDHHALTTLVSEKCGLTSAELLRQIDPQVEERVRGHVTEHGLELSVSKTAPKLAASDRASVTAVVEEVPAQRETSTAPGVKPAVRPPQRKGTVT